MWDCRQGWQGSLGDKGIHQREIQGERTLVSQLAASNKCRSGFGRQITVEPDTFFTPSTPGLGRRTAQGFAGSKTNTRGERESGGTGEISSASNHGPSNDRSHSIDQRQEGGWEHCSKSQLLGPKVKHRRRSTRAYTSLIMPNCSGRGEANSANNRAGVFFFAALGITECANDTTAGRQ
ncbi:hypothetical protein VTN49DRAFT_338 [Thermomyces lanuginosus]|uniref:uncharacterized protein n=1 Tax=Thermomyces lanuginosus TaxID=5541 RepID=UPI0037421886